MKSRNFGEIFKNALGTVFLLAAAFFVCSTFLSVRTVLADPLPGADVVTATPTRGTTATARTTRAAPSRTGGAVTRTNVAPGRTVSSRATPARSVTTRSAAPRTTTAARSVVSRGATPARVSMVGTAMRAPSAAINTSSNYQYLSSKLYTGNYSNIIDPSTGLISADAYSNCMESYYTCMDEICTARNTAQRRCACAGRVRAFADAELNLERANEELIKVSGELALLIATKGKDVSSAFQLTEAEQVMNCVAWRDASRNGTEWTAEYNVNMGGIDWCAAHGIFDGSCSASSAPGYCKVGGNSFGFDVANLDGNSSDILASLKAWADAKEETMTITTRDENGLNLALENITNIVGGLTGGGLDLNNNGSLTDSLAETWGYELFEYAHNNVCSRVLDSCFNGIYEACGTPPSEGRKCPSGGGTCPFNYNSHVTVNNSGSYEINFVTGNTGYTASNSASCFGYSGTAGDPYKTLRGPVADARRSVMQKYALDANADCDAYGEQLRTTAQNIGYQKVAAQQALQKKRLEFAQEEAAATLADTTAAGTNFSQCISELYDCYTTQDDANIGRTAKWSTSRIKTYCATVANSPSCYNTMICNPSTNAFKAVVDVVDSSSCDTSLAASTAAKSACRNVVTLNEILNGVMGGQIAPDGTLGTNADSAALREYCIRQSLGCEGNTCSLRDWQAQ